MTGKIAYIGGTFEIPHLGHANLIRRVQALGYEVIVVVNGDSFVFENRGVKPLYSEKERALLFAQLGVTVDIVPTMKDQKGCLEWYKPDIIVLGDDWLGKDLEAQFCVGEGFFTSRGIGFLFLPRTAGISSSDLKERLGG